MYNEETCQIYVCEFYILSITFNRVTGRLFLAMLIYNASGFHDFPFLTGQAVYRMP